MASSPIPTDEREPLERHPGGRHLDASRDEPLRSAALELLAEIGYDRLTMDAIAARARASKATIYRRWSGKAELIVDALNCEKGESPVPDTGSLRGDLDVVACGSMHSNSQFDTQVMIGLVTALPRDAELREVFRERLVAPRLAGLKDIFERAVARGEIPKVHNLDLLVSLFPAMVLHQLLILGEVPDLGFARRVIEDVILPLVSVPADPSATGTPSPPTRAQR